MSRSVDKPQEGTSSYRLANWFATTYLRPYLWVVLLGFLFMGLQGSMLGAISYLIEPMFDDVFLRKATEDLVWIGSLVLLVFFVRGGSNFLHRVINSWVGERVGYNMRNDLLGHIVKLDGDFFQQHSPGSLLERIVGDINSIKISWLGLVTTVVRDGISLISLITVAFSIDWKWTIIVVACTPLLVVPVMQAQRLTRRGAEVLRESAAVISARMDEIFHGIQEIKLNKQESRQAERVAKVGRVHRRAAVRTTGWQSLVPALINLVAGVGFFGFLLLAGQEVIREEKTVGEFMSFFTATVLLFEPFQRLGRVTMQWQVLKVSLERIWRVLAHEPTITDPTTPLALPENPAGSDIKLRDVHFSYGRKKVLSGVSFVARAGEMTALVGLSGAGKSTIFNLLTRIEEADSGDVTIGGHKIGDMRIDALRGLYSVVSQDAWIFDDSIRNNILLGNPEASEARIREAATAAMVDRFADELPYGLDSSAGIRGTGLSGGQAQRVAIARAFLRDAPVLLLDEPTSSLDSQSEEIVQRALSSFMLGRTVIVISHRLSVVRNAHKIVVLDSGRVVEEGTHDELSKGGGLYSRLNAVQTAAK